MSQLEQKSLCNISNDDKVYFNNISTADKSDSKTSEILKGKDNKSNSDSEQLDLLKVFMNLMPNIFNVFIYHFIFLIEIHFIGKLGDINSLNALSFGILFKDIFFTLVIFGIGEGMSVLCPKSFGSGDLRRLGHQTNQVKIIVGSYFIFYFIFVVLFSKSILFALAGHDKSYVDMAYKYVIIAIPASMLECFSEVLSNYIQAHLVYKPVVIAYCISAVIQFISCFLLVDVFSMGVTGAPVAEIITQLTRFSCLFIYVQFFNLYPESNFWFTRETFRWSTFKETFITCLTTGIIYYSSIGGHCIIQSIANKLNKISYGIFIVGTSIEMSYYTLGYGWMITSSILVNNYIGENSPTNVRKCIRYLFYLSLMIVIPYTIFYSIFRYQFAQFFTSEIHILSSPYLSDVLIILILYQSISFTEAFLVGIIRGMDYGYVTSIVSIIVYIILVPISVYITCFHYGYDIIGLYISMTLGGLLITIIWFIIILYIEIEPLCYNYALGQLNDHALHSDDLELLKNE